MARVRIRQHVNPLSDKYQHPLDVPDWNQVYSNLSCPFHLDIGCGRGRFLLQMAQLQLDTNFLGVEIRQSLVKEANQLRDQYQLKNLHYIYTNINNSSELLLSSLPKNSLELVMIQFPDPWFKKKHFKRRVVQPELVESLAKYLNQKGKIFLQSDVQEIVVEMGDRFLENPNFKPLFKEIWLKENPLQVKTEREVATMKKGQPIYRTMLTNS